MEKSIKEAALHILKMREEAKKNKEQREKEELENSLKEVLQKFEIKFAEFLPMLKADKITWKAGYYRPNNQYYIEFERDGKIIKMEWNNSVSFRYEFKLDQTVGNSTFGDWLGSEYGKERFIMFLYEGDARSQTHGLF